MPTQAPTRRRTHKKYAPPIWIVLPIVAVALLAAALIFRAVVLRAHPKPSDYDLPSWVQEEFLTVNPNSRPGDKLDAVNGVVVHYVGNPGTTAEQNRGYFEGLAENKEAFASSNFLVGLDGETICCVPPDEVAYCSNDRNHDTISIEVCHPDEAGKFGDKSYDSLVRLTQWAVDTYHLKRDQIIRHYDVTGKECPIYYVKNPAAWESFLDQLTF